MKKTRKNTRPSTKMNQVPVQHTLLYCSSIKSIIISTYICTFTCTHTLPPSSLSSFLYSLPLSFLFPVTACHSKAVFLLKFAGLSRVKEENLERPGSPVVQRPSWNQQSKRWRKISAVVGTVGRFKHQVCVCVCVCVCVRVCAHARAQYLFHALSPALSLPLLLLSLSPLYVCLHFYSTAHHAFPLQY